MVVTAPVSGSPRWTLPVRRAGAQIRRSAVEKRRSSSPMPFEPPGRSTTSVALAGVAPDEDPPPPPGDGVPPDDEQPSAASPQTKNEIRGIGLLRCMVPAGTLARRVP